MTAGIVHCYDSRYNLHAHPVDATSGWTPPPNCMQELDRAGQAKAAMFPQANPTGSSRDPQDPSHHLYVTSHGAYGAGEQRHRHYDWDRTGLDPATHSFGERL